MLAQPAPLCAIRCWPGCTRSHEEAYPFEMGSTDSGMAASALLATPSLTPFLWKKNWLWVLRVDERSAGRTRQWTSLGVFLFFRGLFRDMTKRH